MGSWNSELIPLGPDPEAPGHRCGGTCRARGTRGARLLSPRCWQQKAGGRKQAGRARETRCTRSRRRPVSVGRPPYCYIEAYFGGSECLPRRLSALLRPVGLVPAAEAGLFCRFGLLPSSPLSPPVGENWFYYDFFFFFCRFGGRMCEGGREREEKTPRAGRGDLGGWIVLSAAVTLPFFNQTWPWRLL